MSNGSNRLRWFLHRNGQTGGPYDMGTILNWITAGMMDGNIRPEAGSWSSRWLSISEFLELAELIEFEHLVSALVSVHKDCGHGWDWRALAGAPPPDPPRRANRHEAAVAAQIQAYQPTLSEKLLGGDTKRMAELTAALQNARAMDQAEYDQALAHYQWAQKTWGFRRTLAGRILGGDVSAYAEALQHSEAFAAVSAFGVNVDIAAAEPDVVALDCELVDDEGIPREEVKLTPTGKVSTKTMPVARYWGLYQDHVCSCALRIAREGFAVLPISRVIVNLGKVQTNTSTGHPELFTLLAVHFTRTRLVALNLNNIDPSDSMANFECRMQLRKTMGLEPVPPITTDEQWVTT